jgi:hypothetical protein
MPYPGDSGFTQWHDAMKMVARLPGGIPQEFRRRVCRTMQRILKEATRTVELTKLDAFSHVLQYLVFSFPLICDMPTRPKLLSKRNVVTRLSFSVILRSFSRHSIIHLLPPTLSLPCCHLPVMCLDQGFSKGVPRHTSVPRNFWTVLREKVLGKCEHLKKVCVLVLEN